MVNKELLQSVIINNYPEKIVLSKSRLAKYKINKKGERVVSNPRSAGTPKYFVINMQPIYNGMMHYRQRSTVVNKIKDIYYPFFKHLKPFKPQDYPIILELEFTNCTSNTDFDNFTSLLRKCLLDMFVKRLSIITDDTRKYICGFNEIYNEDKTIDYTELKVNFYKK